MKSLSEINKEIAALGAVDLFGTKKEVECLPEIMREDEHVLYLTSGMMDGSTWLIVCTERRIILLDKGMFFGMSQSEISLDKINSVSYTTGFMFGTVEIWHGGARMVIENCDKSTVKRFVDTVNEAVEKYGSPSSSVKKVEAAPETDVMTKLEKLGELKAKGILSDEEFTEQKKKLLANGL